MKELLELIEKYGAGFLFYLVSAFRPASPQDPALTISRTDPSLLVFSLLALAAAAVAYPAATGALGAPGLDGVKEAAGAAGETILAAATYWGFQAVLIYTIAFIAGARGAFLDVLSAVLRVFPAAFLIAACVQFAVREIADVSLGRLDAMWAGAISFIVLHAFLILWRLPANLSFVTWLTPRLRAICAAIAVLLTLSVDLYSVYGSVLFGQAKAQTTKQQSGPPTQGNPPKGSVLCGGCTTQPGRPPGKDDYAQYLEKSRVRVVFSTGSVALSEKSKADLQAIASQAKSNNGYLISVVGYADGAGNAAVNQGLSNRRAAAVAEYLRKYTGVQPRWVIADDPMRELHASDTSTSVGVAQGRSVDVRVLVNKRPDG